MTLSQRLIKFINQTLIHDGSGAPIGDRDSLIQRGVLDSIGLLQVMTFLEEETGIRVPDDEVLPENFETVVQIEELVDRLRSKP
jgi:acyl carrier protein